MDLKQLQGMKHHFLLSLGERILAPYHHPHHHSLKRTLKMMRMIRSMALRRRMLRIDLSIIKGLNLRKSVRVRRVTP